MKDWHDPGDVVAQVDVWCDWWSHEPILVWTFERHEMLAAPAALAGFDSIDDALDAHPDWASRGLRDLRSADEPRVVDHVSDWAHHDMVRLLSGSGGSVDRGTRFVRDNKPMPRTTTFREARTAQERGRVRVKLEFRHEGCRSGTTARFHDARRLEESLDNLHALGESRITLRTLAAIASRKPQEQ